MRSVNFLAVVLLLIAGVAWPKGEAADSGVELSLLDGTHVTGHLVAVSATDVTLLTDAGVQRVSMASLTTDARSRIAVTAPDTDALLRRMAELEKRLAQLARENDQLKRMVTTGPKAGPAKALVPGKEPPSPPPAGTKHSLSSTGKRHNSACRYFAAGRACNAADGVACKLCGG